ncbi:MAG: hypothetical protein KatS3mg024_2211 [Armatimonadota bacterium]|nr:MAG: hypothetical protein KatS3mg024_2211 [Armatimonadota bacterium]
MKSLRIAAALCAASLIIAAPSVAAGGPPICPHANEWTPQVAAWAKGALGSRCCTLTPLRP